MTQPECFEAEESECAGKEPQEPPSNPGRPAEWMILGLFLAVAVFELLAMWKKKRTISQRIQKVSSTRRWFRVLGVIGMALLTWHLLWSGPL